MTTNPAPQISAFEANFDVNDLKDMMERVERTRFADGLPTAVSDYGVPVARVKEFARRWLNGFSLDNWIDKINAWSQFTTTIDGQCVHFIHVRSEHQDAVPLLVLHGWPMCIFEYIDLVDDFVRPHDGTAFHVVMPSLPGFGFSGPTTEPGWNDRRVAKAMVELMTRLGYERFGIHGNDAGAQIAPWIGRAAPERIIGAHVTQIFSFPSGDPKELEDLSKADQKALGLLDDFWNEAGAYNKIQSQQPQTLAHAMVDSPVGWLGWMLQMFPDDIDPDYILATASVHWLMRTAESSMRWYKENTTLQPPKEQTTFPIGLANFQQDFQSIRVLAERDHSNIVQWHTYDEGGHNASRQTPELLLNDIREFFATL